MKKLFALLGICLFCQIAEAQPKNLSPDEAFRSYLAQDSIQDKVGAMLYSRHTKPYYAAAMKKLVPNSVQAHFSIHMQLANYYRMEAQMDSALLEIKAIVANGFPADIAKEFFPADKWQAVMPQIDSLFAIQPQLLNPYIDKALRTKVLQILQDDQQYRRQIPAKSDTVAYQATMKKLREIDDIHTRELDSLLAKYGWISDSLIGYCLDAIVPLFLHQYKDYQMRVFMNCWKSAQENKTSWNTLNGIYTGITRKFAWADTCPLLFIPTTAKGRVENYTFQAHSFASLVHDQGFPSAFLSEIDPEVLKELGIVLTSNPIRIGIIQYPEEKPSEAKKYAKGLKQFTDYMLAHGAAAKDVSIVWEPIPASHVQQMDMLEGQKPRYWYQFYEKKKD